MIKLWVNMIWNYFKTQINYETLPGVGVSTV